MNKLGLLALLTPLLVACGSSDGGAGPGTTSGVEQPQNQLSIDTATYTVKKGEEVRYFCYTMHVPDDKDLEVTEIEPIYGQATHHLGVYAPLVDEPEGQFMCDQLIKPTWIPMYGGGVESTKLDMPTGASMHVKKGQQILIQLHLLNSTNETVTDKATIVLHTTDEKDTIGAGIYGFSNNAVQIPADAANYAQGMSCNASRDMDVFAVFGHMHTYGRKIEMSRGVNPGDDVLYSANWDFNNQPTVPMAFHVNKGDNLHLRCWYDNTSPNEVSYGESTTDEMCAFVFYYTPYTTLDGCEME